MCPATVSVDVGRSPWLMTVNEPALGRCPRCDREIPATYLLIEYETEEGLASFAECPGCGEVVAPSRSD